MRKSWIILNAALLLLFLGVPPSHSGDHEIVGSVGSGQDSVGAGTDPQRRTLAVGLVQAIGTVEGSEKAKTGSYVDWPTLRAHHADYLDKFIAAFRQQLPWGDPPEILPGLSLRMNVHADGQGYDIWLEDLTDKNCGFAVFNDEIRGIRQTVKYELLAVGRCHIPVEINKKKPSFHCAAFGCPPRVTRRMEDSLGFARPRWKDFLPVTCKFPISTREKKPLKYARRFGFSVIDSGVNSD